MCKRLFAVWLSCICFVAAGQGLVNFFNNSATLIDGINGSPATGVETYYFALLVAPVGTTNSNLFTFTGCYATNMMAAPGRINGGWGVAVKDWPPGTAKAFLVCGWPASAGHDWDPNYWLHGGRPFGVSKIATGVAGGGGFPPTLPLNLFSSSTISSGFVVWGCLGPLGVPVPSYWEGMLVWPTDQIVVVGGAAVFEARASACPSPFYQWYFNGSQIPGATDYLYRIGDAQPADAGNYSVMLSNPMWPECCRTQGVFGATLTVLTQPLIDSQPQSQRAFVGSTVELQVAASGGPLSYQWFFNGAYVPGGTSPDFWLTNVQVADSGRYTVVITNVYGAITSSPAILTVLAAPPTIVLSPWSRTVVAGRFVDLVVKAEGGLPLSYQWSFNGNPIAGATSSVLHRTHLEVAQSGAYSVEVTNLFGSAASPPALLNVIPLPDYPTGNIVGWGATNPLPAVWNDIIAISAGGDHDLALRKDGTVVAWGQNTFGQSTVPAGLADVIQVSAGGSHSLALKADGSVVAWGLNSDGQTDVPAGLSNVVAIVAAGWRSLALTSGGDVVVWGQNWIGIGEETVPTNLDGVVAIAASWRDTLALRFDGRVVGWGYNVFGECSVPSDVSGVTAVAAGGSTSLALRSDGTVMSWGAIATIRSGLDGVIGIAAADCDSAEMALRFDGTVVAGGEAQTSMPADLADVIAISAGGCKYLALVAQPSVTQGKPPKVMPPSSTTAEIGSVAQFSVRTAGDAPFYFQWFFNSLNAIPGGTNATLELSNVQLAQAGAYTVEISNAFGAVSSAPAMLSVIPPLDRRLVPGVQVTGQTGSTVKLYYLNDMELPEDWMPLTEFELTDEARFSFDLTEPLKPQRFYRVSQTSPGGQAPNASLSMVPALTLTGAVGASVRVEYINQFAPIDSWATLDTITLTNVSQLFFDTSAIGQPPRLWRVVPVP